jgi:BASS family bile acid:Na+ symporter
MTPLQFLVDYGVPINLLMLMFVAGTEIRAADFRALRRDPSPAVIGAIGQLALLPPIALAIVNSLQLHPTVAMGTLILSLCPGGGISNTYSYLARCNVLLSAMITTIGTLVSLVTIPLWLGILPAMPGTRDLHAVPAVIIIAQLLAFMVLPLGLGIITRHWQAEWIERVAPTLRRISTIMILVILVAAIATVGRDLLALAREIVMTATLFILSAMLLGSALAIRMSHYDGPVVVIESGVRNVGVALILGSALLDPKDFGLFASFVSGYFVVEIVIMLTYAATLANRRST